MSLASRFKEPELWPIAIDWKLGFCRPETQQGLRYWRSLCAGRPMPERRDLDPRAMARFLPFVNLVEATAAGPGACNGAWNYTVTLQGSHSREVLGAVRGRNLAEIFPTAIYARWRNCFELPRSGGMPVRLLTRASTSGKNWLACEALLAPLGRSSGVEALFWVFAAWPDGRVGTSRDRASAAASAPGPSTGATSG